MALLARPTISLFALLTLSLSTQAQAQTTQPARTKADSVVAAEQAWVAQLRRRAIQPRTKRGFRAAPAGFALYFLSVDTLRVPYWVYVPKGYKPTHAYPTLVYLHGGVVSISQFQYKEADYATEPIFPLAEAYQALVIYPFGRKDFGWVNQVASFEYILRAVEAVKQTYHVDERRLFLGGMSNGGSAAFWFASNHAAAFTGFYSFSALPKLKVGVIDFSQLATKPFYSLHALDDSLYRYKTVKAIYTLHHPEATAWHLEEVRQGGHGFIYGSQGEAEMKQLLNKLLLAPAKY